MPPKGLINVAVLRQGILKRAFLLLYNVLFFTVNSVFLYAFHPPSPSPPPQKKRRKAAIMMV